MKIFHLYRKEGPSYDEYDAKIIVAENEEKARQIANQHTECEGEIWEDMALVNCEIVNTEREGVILASFNAG